MLKKGKCSKTMDDEKVPPKFSENENLFESNDMLYRREKKREDPYQSTSPNFESKEPCSFSCLCASCIIQQNICFVSCIFTREIS
jgi:hypothetical protein